MKSCIGIGRLAFLFLVFWFDRSYAKTEINKSSRFSAKPLEIVSSLHSYSPLNAAESLNKLSHIHTKFTQIIRGEMWMLASVNVNDSGIFTLEIPNASIDTVEVWKIEENNRLNPILVGGDHYPSSKLLGGINSPFRHIGLAPGNHRFLIKYIQKGRYPHTLFLIHPQKGFQQKKTQQLIINGIFIGFCLFLFLLSAIIGLYLRKTIFLYYSIWTLLQFAYFTCSLGFLKYWLYPETPLINSTLRAFISAVIPLFFTLLISEQLNQNNKFHTIKKLNLSIIFLSSLLFLFERIYPYVFWENATFWILLITVLSAIGTVTSAIVIVLSFKKFHINPLIVSFCFILQITLITILIVVESESSRIDFLELYTYLGLLPLVEVTTFGVLIGWNLTKTMQLNHELLKENLKLQTESQEIYANTLEEERKRIAMELHDSSLNRISMLSMLLTTNTINSDHIQSEIAAIGDEIRQTSYALYPPWMDALSFQEVMEREIGHVQKTTALTLDFSFFDWHIEPLENQKRHLLRIIQEFIQNTIKHGKANFIRLYFFQRDMDLIIEMEDDGVGYKSEDRQPGLGSISVETRIMLMKGQISVSSKPGMGVNWMITIPLQQNESVI